MADFRVLLNLIGGSSDPPPKLDALMDAVGTILLDTSIEAFDKREWDGSPWPRRYPNQNPFVVNVAGLVSDMENGPTDRDRRNPGTVMQDTGNLLGSLTFRVLNSTSVEMGTTVEYASRLQQGTPSSQAITETVKDNLETWLNNQDDPEELGDAVGWLFNVDQLVTTPHPRQFVPTQGTLPKQTLEDIVKTATAFIESGGERFF